MGSIANQSGFGDLASVTAQAAAVDDQLHAVTHANPHCDQLKAPTARPFLKEALQHRDMTEKLRFLSSQWPQMPYKWRPDNERSSCHWGQLKLFECELKCLTDFGLACPSAAVAATAEPPLVIYVGAAPGRHVAALVRRIQRCHFELYDPADFDASLCQFAASEEAGGRVTLVQGFFDETRAKEIAARSANRVTIFFSDIRTADAENMEEAQIDLSIKRDMSRQSSWVKLLRPTVSLLKFRLPWGKGESSYLRGRLMVQAFAPCTSTESRLLVTKASLDAGELKYDHEVYEQQLMHHNTVGRAQRHSLRDVPLHGSETSHSDASFDDPRVDGISHGRGRGCGREGGRRSTVKTPSHVEAASDEHALYGLATTEGNEHDTVTVPGLDECYDCAALVGTVRNFLAARRGLGPASSLSVLGRDVAREIRSIICEIGASATRTLATRYHVSFKRHSGIRFNPRRYVDSSGADCLVVFPKLEPPTSIRPSGPGENVSAIDEAGRHCTLSRKRQPLPCHGEEIAASPRAATTTGPARKRRARHNEPSNDR
eukprot:TRINITY_DN49142_c0_g1_i1.p1 TRINITY_DN49142_c0_g1~~TRINITY_DN49142_c0_g1_i1.p1  ORF type:complete len:544 (+),score=70.22 TRINITY_DN49142_c0_g1_i1:69-1700(+)